MTESKRRPRSLKGAVLIMVVTILFILIVMLLATLAVVSSSTQRTYTKYAETQAYYSARSVLDVYLGTTLSNATVITDSGEANNVVTAMKEHFAEVSYNDGTGTAVAGLKSVSGQYKDFADEDLTVGFAHQQEIFGYLVPKYQWDDSGVGTAQVKDDSNWKLNEDYNDDVKHGHGDKYYVEYEVKTPNLSTGIAKTAAGSFSEDDKVTLRIELLRILYCNKDGDIITDNVGYTDISGLAPDGQILYTYVEDPTDPKCSQVVDWNGTYYRLKVTATANMRDKHNGDDNKVSVSVMLEPKVTVEKSVFKNALTSIDGTSAGHSIFTVGGASARDPGSFMVTKDGTQAVGSHVYNTTSMMDVGYKQWKMTAGESYVVYGGYLCLDDPMGAEKVRGLLSTSEISDINQRPYIYTEGFIKQAGDTFIGCNPAVAGDAPGGKIDIITTYHRSGTVENLEGDNIDFWGLYEAEAHNKTSGFKKHIQYNPWWGEDKEIIPERDLTLTSPVTNSACSAIGVDNEDEMKKMAFWVKENELDIYGDVYCDGNMYLGPMGTRFHGNVYCTGYIYYTNDSNGLSKMQFDGSVYANGYRYAGDGGVPTATITGIANSDILGPVTFNAAWDESKITTDKEKKLEIDLSGCPGGRDKVRVSSTQDVTDGYRDNSGNIISAEEKFKKDIGEPSAESLAVSATSSVMFGSAGPATFPYGPTFKFVETVDGVDYEVPATGAKYIDLTASPAVKKGSVYEVLFDFGAMGNNNNDTYILDTKGQKIKIQFKGATSNSQPHMVIYGTVPKTDAQITAMGLDPNDTSDEVNALKNPSDVFITVDTDSFVNFTNNYSLSNVQIYDMVKNDKMMYVGENIPSSFSKYAPEPPKILWYIGKDAAMLWNNGDKTFICGYIYGPEAYLNAQKANELSKKINYNGHAVDSMKYLCCYGSAVFKGIETGTAASGFVYIKPESGAGKGGAGTNIFWENKVYLNR